MIPFVLGVAFFVLLVWAWRRARLRKRLASTPLAGYDTGTRWARSHERGLFRNGRTL